MNMPFVYTFGLRFPLCSTDSFVFVDVKNQAGCCLIYITNMKAVFVLHFFFL